MKILSLNCQKAYNKNLKKFLFDTLNSEKYDFILLQEATEKVHSFIKHPAYCVLTAYNDRARAQSLLCIVHRKEHTLVSSELSYVQKDLAAKRPGFGALCGAFSGSGKHIHMASVHLPSGVHSTVRRTAFASIVKALARDSAVIIGGDFNLGPFEKRHIINIAAPDLVCLTEFLGPTLNSKNTEPGPFIPNIIAQALCTVGLGIKLPADHFFASRSIAQKKYVTRILPDAVSDHSPIELIIDTVV